MPDGFIERMGLQAVLDIKEFRQNAQFYEQRIKQLNQQTRAVAEQTQKSADQMAGAWDHFFKQVEANTQGVSQSYRQIGEESKKAAKTAEDALAAMAKKAIAAAGAYMTLRKAFEFEKEATLLAARVETLGVALETVGKNAGYNASEMAAFEEGVKEMGITTQGARQALLFMAQAEIDFAHATELARIAQNAAVIADVDSTEAFQRLTWVITTGSVRMARYLGLQVSFQRGYEEMARQLGKTTEELTEMERVQARVNVVLRAGEQIAGTYETAMTTAGKLMHSLNRLFEEARLVIGQVNLGGFAVGIDEVTRLAKELLKWMEENEQELRDMGVAVEQLTRAMVSFADLELPVEELTTFVDRTTTLVSVLAAGIEQIETWRDELRGLAIDLQFVQQALDGVFPALAAQRGINALIDRTTELRKENQDLFLTFEQQAAIVSKFKEPWEEIAEREKELAAERAAAQEEALATYHERLRQEEEAREKVVEKLQDYFDRIEDMQRDHELKLADLADDHRLKQERAWAKYEQSVIKEIAKGQEAIAKLEESYGKRRAKTIADYQKRIAKAEEAASEARVKAQEDFERRERQARERYQLDMLQSERHYQFERNRLVAEGDTLAIEELDARYKMEQEEARENEALRQRQAREGQTEQIREAGEAAREQIDELRQQLAETLTEQETNYFDQIEAQKQANQDRLDEMAASFVEQQRLADEDYQISVDKAERNYERQQEDLGRNLARQEELQELGAGEVAALLERYYGEDGVADRIMKGWHERENARILTTAALMTTLGEWKPLEPGGIPMPGQEVGMDVGGVVTGPATVRVGAGVVEAFTPLAYMGGGSFDVSWSGGPIPISGLEGASPEDRNKIARDLAIVLTQKMRVKRRH